MPETELIQIMRPNLFLTIDFAAVRAATKAARRFTSITLSKSSSLMRISKLSRVMPALFTRIPIPPCSEDKDSSVSVNLGVSVISTHFVITEKPASLTTVSSSVSGVYVEAGDDAALLEQLKNNCAAYSSGGTCYNSKSFFGHLLALLVIGNWLLVNW